MKPYFFCLILLFCFAAVVNAAETGSPEPFQLQSVQADFQQEKHLEILAAPILSTGTFLFQAPGSLRWEYSTPVRSILLMHEGRVRKFIHRDGQWQEEQTHGLDSMQIILADMTSWLDGRFSDNAMFEVSHPEPDKVLLVPRDKSLAGLISRIELTLAEQKGLLDEVTVFEGPDSYTRLTFSNRLLNREIPVSRFLEP